MIATSELRSLPVAERLRLVEELWNSIAEEEGSVPDPPAVVAELRLRKTRFAADPASGVPWREAKRRVRLGRA